MTFISIVAVCSASLRLGKHGTFCFNIISTLRTVQTWDPCWLCFMRHTQLIFSSPWASTYTPDPKFTTYSCGFATIYLPLFLLLKMVMVKHIGVPCGISKWISNILPRICESVVNSVTHRSKNDQDPTKCVTGFRVSRGSYPDFERFVTLKFVSDPCQYTNRKRTGEIDLFRIILGVKIATLQIRDCAKRVIHGF